MTVSMDHCIAEKIRERQPLEGISSGFFGKAQKAGN
jgi:hypothetical protein